MILKEKEKDYILLKDYYLNLEKENKKIKKFYETSKGKVFYPIKAYPPLDELSEKVFFTLLNENIKNLGTKYVLKKCYVVIKKLDLEKEEIYEDEVLLKEKFKKAKKELNSNKNVFRRFFINYIKYIYGNRCYIKFDKKLDKFLMCDFRGLTRELLDIEVFNIFKNKYSLVLSYYDENLKMKLKNFAKNYLKREYYYEKITSLVEKLHYDKKFIKGKKEKITLSEDLISFYLIKGNEAFKYFLKEKELEKIKLEKKIKKMLKKMLEDNIFLKLKGFDFTLLSVLKYFN